MPSIFTRGAISALAYGYVTASRALDPYFKYVAMLLSGNGTNGAQNNTFLDGSANAFSITRNGNATQGTFSPYGSNWSGYFSGTSDYLTIADNTAFDFGSGDWTVECWIYRTGGGNRTSQVVYNQSVQGATSNSTMYLGAGSDGFSMYLSTSGTAWTNNIETATAASLYTWSHVVWQRRSNTLEIYLNGTLQTVASGSSSFSGTLFNSSRNIDIGVQSAGTGFSPFYGYISNLRAVKGTAVYTSNFTPPTAPLTAISGTSLLTCQSNRFIDTSGNAFTITTGGAPAVQRLNPFSPTSAYSSSTNGGSGYFDGTGDYLSVADNAALEVGSGNFTLECWFYPLGSVSANGSVLVSKSNSSSFGPYSMAFSPTAPYYMQALCSTNGTAWDISIVTTTTYTSLKNSWHHAALVRNGSTFNLYLDGVSIGSATNSNALIDNTNNFQISYINFANTEWNGFISDVRLTKSAVYTATFTPPTAPLAAITNTQLLCNFTNAGIGDSAAVNDLETVGNAQISTTQSKFGGSSISFDGTGDYLVASGGNVTGAFNQLTSASGVSTFEAWVYFSALTSPRSHIIGAWSGSVGWTYDITSAGDFAYTNNGASTTVTLSSKFTTGSWQFLTVTNNGTTVTIYKDGTSVGSFAVQSPTSYTGPMTIGARSDNTLPMNGYIDDFRLTRGYVRYTGNFTPPSSQFPVS